MKKEIKDMTEKEVNATTKKCKARLEVLRRQKNEVLRQKRKINLIPQNELKKLVDDAINDLVSNEVEIEDEYTVFYEINENVMGRFDELNTKIIPTPE
jgi:hypothetical protein